MPDDEVGEAFVRAVFRAIVYLIIGVKTNVFLIGVRSTKREVS